MPEYQHVSLAEVASAPNACTEKKELDEAVDAGGFGFNVYAAEPGERLPWGYHYHPDHEELFYVLEGELTVETPDREYVVGEDEALYVGPDSPQVARASGEGTARVIAVGAPKESDDAVVREPCPDCGEATGRDHEARTEDGEEVYVLYCADCGAEADVLRP